MGAGGEVGKHLEDFPCLEHDYESKEYDIGVCVAPDGHDGEHSFVDAADLMVSLGEHGPEFAVETPLVN